MSSMVNKIINKSLFGVIGGWSVTKLSSVLLQWIFSVVLAVD